MLSEKLFASDKTKKSGPISISTTKSSLEKSLALFSQPLKELSKRENSETLYLKSFISYLLNLIDALLKHDFGIPKETILAEVPILIFLK